MKELSLMTTPREAYKNWHEKAHSDRTVGDRVADAVAHGMGSWKFIIIQTCIVLVWMSIISFCCQRSVSTRTGV